MRAISVLGNAKSNSHRKTHQVEPDGTGPKIMFMHLTRGDLRCESGGEVSRGRSSKDARRKAGGAKGRRIERANRVGRGVAESPETSGSGAKFGFPRGKDPEDSGFCSEGNRRRQGCSPATKTKLSKVQPPDTENRTSGGGEGLRGETPRSPIRSLLDCCLLWLWGMRLCRAAQEKTSIHKPNAVRLAFLCPLFPCFCPLSHVVTAKPLTLPIRSGRSPWWAGRLYWAMVFFVGPGSRPFLRLWAGCSSAAGSPAAARPIAGWGFPLRRRKAAFQKPRRFRENNPSTNL